MFVLLIRSPTEVIADGLNSRMYPVINTFSSMSVCWIIYYVTYSQRCAGRNAVRPHGQHLARLTHVTSLGDVTLTSDQLTINRFFTP